jgi:hypothetical protein
MKKLLALVLCVMMFVSVLSTSAFAADPKNVDYSVQPQPETSATAKWGSLSAANKAISNTKKNIDYIYGALAADTAVFGTVQAMDSVVVDMVKGLLADVDSIKQDYVLNGVKGTLYVTHDALEKNAKAVLRNAIGGEVADYMRDHIGNYASVSQRLITTWGGNTYDVKKVGTTKEGLANVYYGTDGYIYTMDANKNWKYIEDADLFNVIKTYVDKDMTQTQWDKLTTAEKAAWATTLSATNNKWKADGGVHDSVLDYQYDPMKYANNFATAVTKALSSEKGVANLQAYAYGLMQLKVADAVSDKMDDLATAIADWEDGTKILGQYGFHDFNVFGEISSNPLAFIDPEVLPKDSMNLSAITNGNETNYFVPDFLAD